MDNIDNFYTISIEIEENQNSIDFFNNISELLLSINSLNNALCRCLYVQVETKIMLSGVEHGSIKILLIDVLNKVSDENIIKLINNPKEIIKSKLADFLIKAKYKLLKVLKGEPNLLIKSVDEVVISSIMEAGLSEYGYNIKTSYIKSNF